MVVYLCAMMHIIYLQAFVISLFLYFYMLQKFYENINA